MLNNLQGNDVARECTRLQGNLTQRGFRRFTERLFGDNTGELKVVFDLRAGESPKKSVFERMAGTAERHMMYVLETAQYFSLVEKKRSPKFGTVTYLLKAAVDTAADQYKLRGVLLELKELADTCSDVDIQGHALFA